MLRSSLALVVSLGCLAACGGSVSAVADDSPRSDDGSGSETSPPLPTAAPSTPGTATGPEPADGPWGIWRMNGLDGPPGQRLEGAAPSMQLELRPDGTAYRTLCTDTRTAVVCAPELTYACLAGTVFWDGARWRVDIPAIRVGGVPEQGEIVREPDDGLLVRYIYPTYSAGHFVRAGDGGGACPR